MNPYDFAQNLELLGVPTVTLRNGNETGELEKMRTSVNCI